MFANGPGDLGSITGRVILKTQKMVLDATLISTQHYKVRVKEQFRESRSALPYSLVAIEKGAFWSPSTTVANFFTLFKKPVTYNFYWFTEFLKKVEYYKIYL